MDVILAYVKMYLEITGDIFNNKLIIIINGAVRNLVDMGVSDFEGVSIDDSTTWPVTTLPNDLQQSIRLYLCHTVRMAFDPTGNAQIYESYKNHKAELEETILIGISKLETEES